MNGVVATRAIADSKWTTRIVRPGNQGVVWAFAVRSADGVNRRKVEHLKAHLSYSVEALLCGPEISADGYTFLVSCCTLRSWEKLIPGTGACKSALAEHCPWITQGLKIAKWIAIGYKG